jgi:hypothetical protein
LQVFITLVIKQSNLQIKGAPGGKQGCRMSFELRRMNGIFWFVNVSRN